jgi:uncharacterized protein YkwD
MRWGARALGCASMLCVSALAVPATAPGALPQLSLPEVPAVGGAPVPSLVPAPVVSMVAAVNAARARRGLGPLQPSASLRRSATGQSVWMLKADRFSHRSRIHASRRFRFLGEAIGYHTGWSASVGWLVRHWLNSPPHRKLLLSKRFRYLGAGMSRGRFKRTRATAWTLHFGG